MELKPKYRLSAIFTLVAIATLLIGQQVVSISAISYDQALVYNNLSNTDLCTYKIVTDGTDVTAISCDTGAITYGGQNDAGSVDGNDDDAVIQAALDAMTSGGKLFVIRGAYTVDAPLKINDNTTFECEDWTAEFTSTTGNIVIIRNKDWTDGNHDIVLRNCAVDGGDGEGQDGSITFEDVDRLLVEGVKSVDSPAEGIKTRDANEVIITNNFINRTGFVDGTSGRACINAATGSGYLVMTDNVCIDAAGEAYGVYRNVNSKVVVANNVAIVNDADESPFWRGHILIESDVGAGKIPDDVVVSGNSIVSNYYGINVISGTGITIANNVLESFADTSLHGINISGSNPFYISITGNVIRDYGQHCINIEDSARRMSITGNVCLNPSQNSTGTYHGINLEPHGGALRDLTIVGNTITDEQGTPTMDRAILVNASAQQIHNLNIVSNTLVGFTSTKAIEFDLDNTANSQINTSYIGKNLGYAEGKIASPFDNTNNRIGLQTRGTVTQAVNGTASTTYIATLHDLIITSTGGTDVSITITDASGNTVLSGVTTLSGFYLPQGWKINFGGWSVSPTVTVFAV